MTAPELTVVVPTYRRPRLLERCLAALGHQDLPRERFEVVVVDDGSGGETAEVLRRASVALENLRPVSLATNGGPARARNRGVAEAAGPVVLFLDDDVTATPSLVRTHLELHAGGDERLGVLGLVEWAPELRVSPFMRWLDRNGLQFGYETWLTAGPVDPPYAAFYTANLSLRRALFDEVGGFDERFPYAAYEDMELAWRLHERGFRLEYRPEALAYHSRPMTLRDYRGRMERVAESAVLLRAVQPTFPVDEEPASWALRRRDRLALRLLAPLARLLGAHVLLDRHYRAEVGAAFAAGRRRA